MRRQILPVLTLFLFISVGPSYALSIYLVGNESEDSNLLSLLRSPSWGHDVEVHGVSEDDPQDAVDRGFDLAYLAPSGTSTGMGGWAHMEIPIIVGEPGADDINHWCNPSTPSGSYDNGGVINILDSTHPITAGIGPGAVQIVNATGGNGTNDVVTHDVSFVGHVLADGNVSGGNNAVTVGYMDIGDEDYGSDWMATHRRVFLPFPADSGQESGFTPAGEQLLEQAIAWAIPEPATVGFLAMGALPLVRRRRA